jgi:hypothetical protein
MDLEANSEEIESEEEHEEVPEEEADSRRNGPRAVVDPRSSWLLPKDG